MKTQTEWSVGSGAMGFILGSGLQGTSFLAPESVGGGVPPGAKGTGNFFLEAS